MAASQTCLYRATVYLDVDGVLLPTSHDAHPDFEWRSAADGSRWAPEVVSDLAGLPAEVVWLTTWQEEANTFLCPLFGWDPLPVCRRRPEVIWWKFEALLRDHPGGPFVWIDDELDQRLTDNTTIRPRLDAIGTPYLLVSPAPRRGMDRVELQRVAEFLATHS